MGFLQNAVQNKIRESHMNDVKEIVRKICKDGIVKSLEKEHLYQEGQKWYFSEEELDAMIQNQMARNRQNFLENELADLIEEACHDTIISPQERVVLYNKASVWKISEEEVDTLIEQGLSRRSESLNRQKAAFDAAVSITSAIGNGIGTAFKGIGGFISKIQEDRHKERMAQQNSQSTLNQPTKTPPIPTTQSSKKYMLAIGGQQYGPYSTDQLKEMIPTKQFAEQTYVWTEGMSSWVMANQVPDLALLFTPAMPATPPMPPIPDAPAAPNTPQMPPMP